MFNLKFLFSLAFVLASAGPLSAGIIRQDFNALVHGQIVDDEFSSGLYGFTVIGDNLQDDRDWVVAFDTFRSNTNDSDLQDPFQRGNIAKHNGIKDLMDPNLPNGYDQEASRFKDALIIQETGVGSSNDGEFLDDPNGSAGPDDEGSRPAGSIGFAFNNAITEFGFDLLDVEGPLEKFSLVFSQDGQDDIVVGFDEFITPGSTFYQNGDLDGDSGTTDDRIEFGNRSANRIVPITIDQLNQLANTTIESFDRVQVNLGGSGAIDNIRYNSTVPEPLACLVWLNGLALVVAHGARRKRVA